MSCLDFDMGSLSDPIRSCDYTAEGHSGSDSQRAVLFTRHGLARASDPNKAKHEQTRAPHDFVSTKYCFPSPSMSSVLQKKSSQGVEWRKSERENVIHLYMHFFALPASAGRVVYTKGVESGRDLES